MVAPARILIAKTALDGHWRGTTIVSHALRDAGFEVILLGMATAQEVVDAAIQEDVDLVGLNIGGHPSVAERIIEALAESIPDLPVFVGGVVPPWARKRLQASGVDVFPPGSQLADIVAAAVRLTSQPRPPTRNGA